MADLLTGWFRCTRHTPLEDLLNEGWEVGQNYYFFNGRTTITIYGIDKMTRRTWPKAEEKPVLDSAEDGIRLASRGLVNLPTEDFKVGNEVYVHKYDRHGRVTNADREAGAYGVLTNDNLALTLFPWQMHKLSEEEMLVKNPCRPQYIPPEIGMHVRDKKTLKVWRVEEVKLPECRCEKNPCHGGYAELKLMTTTHDIKPVYFDNEPYFFIPNTMCHETDLEHFWDNYEEYEDLGWSGMYFDQKCNCGKGKIITVCNGQIAPGSYDDGRRFKSFEEIKSHIPNIIEVDSTTYCEQDDPAEDFFTGYALCVENTRKVYYHNTLYKTSTIPGLTVGKIYRMTAGHYIDDNGDLNDCDPNEFSKHFVEVHDLE